MKTEILTKILLPGDVLLFPTESLKLNILLPQEILNNLIKHMQGQKYLHQEILLQGTYSLQQTNNGVYIIKRKLQDFKNITVKRHVRYKQITKEKLLETIKKYWNLPYDFSQLFLNIVSQFFQGFPQYEEFMQSILKKLTNYENQSYMICSEVVQRIYKDLDLPLFDKNEEPDFVSPQNLYDSPYLRTIYEPLNKKELI